MKSIFLSVEPSGEVIDSSPILKSCGNCNFCYPQETIELHNPSGYKLCPDCLEKFVRMDEDQRIEDLEFDEQI